MGKSFAVEDLLGRIYESARDPELWPSTVATIAEATGCRNGVLYEYDIPTRRSFFLAAHGIDRVFVDNYEDRVGAIDPWNQRVLGWPAGVVAPTYALIGDDDLRRTDFYQQHLRPERIFYGIGGVVHRTPDRMAVFGVQCDYKDGRFTAEARELIAVLMPHLSRAYQMQAALRDIKLRSDTLVETLNLLRQPVLIVDREGTLIFANRAAEDLLAQGDGLRFAAGHVVAAHRGDRAPFLALLQADRNLKSAATGLQLRRRSGRPAFTVEAVPLAAGSDRVAVLIGISGNAPYEFERLTRRFAVTSAEARLWSGLASGATLIEIATSSGVSVNTLRVQLAGLFRKVGVHRQADLVRLALE